MDSCKKIGEYFWYNIGTNITIFINWMNYTVNFYKIIELKNRDQILNISTDLLK
jgi:hypothetical protein